MNLNGKKQAKAKTGKDRMRELETELQNTAMATRISQMMLKQVLEQFQNLRQDIDNTMGILNDFQYRTQAMMSIGNFDLDLLDKKAEELKLKDYMDASDKEDLDKGYSLNDSGLVNENSIVIITSITNGDNNRGIFRSKFPVSECFTETLKASLLGSKVGDSFEEIINGDVHNITVLGIRQAQPKQVEETEGQE
jgi:hypothetical protein